MKLATVKTRISFQKILYKPNWLIKVQKWHASAMTTIYIVN